MRSAKWHTCLCLVLFFDCMCCALMCAFYFDFKKNSCFAVFVFTNASLISAGLGSWVRNVDSGVKCTWICDCSSLRFDVCRYLKIFEDERDFVVGFSGCHKSYVGINDITFLEGSGHINVKMLHVMWSDNNVQVEIVPDLFSNFRYWISQF